MVALAAERLGQANDDDHVEVYRRELMASSKVETELTEGPRAGRSNESDGIDRGSNDSVHIPQERELDISRHEVIGGIEVGEGAAVVVAVAVDDDDKDTEDESEDINYIIQMKFDQMK